MTLTFQGTTHNVHDWAKITGLSESAIYHRKRRGLSDEQTLTNPKLSHEESGRKGKGKSFWRFDTRG